MHVVCNCVLSKLSLEHRRQTGEGKADIFMPRYLDSTSQQSTAVKSLSACILTAWLRVAHISWFKFDATRVPSTSRPSLEDDCTKPLLLSMQSGVVGAQTVDVDS